MKYLFTKIYYYSVFILKNIAIFLKTNVIESTPLVFAIERFHLNINIISKFISVESYIYIYVYL